MIGTQINFNEFIIGKYRDLIDFLLVKTSFWGNMTFVCDHTKLSQNDTINFLSK